jgi:Rps23 Pro-64 3,4-dihydroxylase Tpa1-like proline 4-hydroxylase
MINFSLPKYIKTQYATAYPYPHTVIDNFMNEQFLNRAVNQLEYVDWGYDDGDGDDLDSHQVKKLYSPHKVGMWDNMPEHVTNLLNFLNSKEVLNYLEELTGIPDLIADPELYGGGVHRILSGGKLSVHADYNFHPLTKLHRRVNLLLYLNKDWKEEWGGDLQLWNKDMSMCVKKILPIFNRAVIFNITSDAYHGHPGPLKSPEGIDRLSFALYYFTKERPVEEITDPHMAVWKEV